MLNPPLCCKPPMWNPFKGENFGSDKAWRENALCPAVFNVTLKAPPLLRNFDLSKPVSNSAEVSASNTTQCCVCPGVRLYQDCRAWCSLDSFVPLCRRDTTAAQEAFTALLTALFTPTAVLIVFHYRQLVCWYILFINGFLVQKNSLKKKKPLTSGVTSPICLFCLTDNPNYI